MDWVIGFEGSGKDGFAVYIEGLSGCFSVGDTLVEALAGLPEVFELWCDAAFAPENELRIG